MGSAAHRRAFFEDAYPDGIRFLPHRSAELQEGYFLARRSDWAPDARWTVVGVATVFERGEFRTVVMQIGSDRMEAPDCWQFRSRVVGIEELTAAPPPHPAIEVASCLQ